MNPPLFGQPGTLVGIAYLAFVAGSAFGILVRHRSARRYTCDRIGSEGAWA